MSPWKSRPATAILLALAILASGSAIGYLALDALAPVSGLQEGGRLFEVRKGEGASALALRLRAEGLIKSSFAFKVASKVLRHDGDIKAGSYLIERGMGTVAILERIASGKQVLLKITLPEGLTLSEAARMLDSAGISAFAEFMAAARDPALLAELRISGMSAEGYLFPDTYFMPRGFGGPPALRVLVANFREKLAALPEAVALDEAEIARRLILASIVEREYRVPDEAPLMASVFANRLRIGMGLQSCATVVYVITEHLGKPHPDVVYDRDLRIADPYNTYLNSGLPPGPISNPGLVALRAALNPPSTRWLYFRLVDPDKGIHHFSTTLEEHLGAAKLIVKKASGS